MKANSAFIQTCFCKSEIPERMTVGTDSEVDGVRAKNEVSAKLQKQGKLSL
jgi:hypothetical protein